MKVKMKKVISVFLSIVLLVSIIGTVDLSSYASEDIPSYKNFQAQCYSMDDVYGVFEVDTYNHVFAEAFKNNSDFQESVAVWEITNQLLDPSSIAGTQMDKIQYYELMLFDVIDSASKNTNLLRYLTDRYESYIISATKKITEAIPESDYSTYFYDTLSVSTAEKITNIINKTPEMMDALKNAQDILKTAKTGVDYILNLARYQITYDLSNYEIEVLRTIKSNTNNAYLKAAVDEVIAYQENILTETLVEAIHVTEFTVEIIFNVAVGALWSAICQPIACLNLVYKGTKAAVDAWLATDDIIQAYYSIAALDDFETALKSSMNSLRNNYLSSPTDNNAELFMAAIGLYERSVVMGCNYVESVLDAQYKKAAWGIIFKSENEMNDRYQQLQNYKTTVINSFNSIEESCKSIYLKKYYTNYNDLLDFYDEEAKVIPINGLSCNDKNLTIAVNEDYFVTASFTPSNTTETQLKYSNSNDKVISITDFGNIRGLSEGTSTITIYSAVDNSIRDTMTVTVSGHYDSVTGNTTYTDEDGNETVIKDAHYKDYTYSVSNGTATITKYSGSSSTVYVPSTLGGYPVKTIGAYAFQNCNFSSIILPDSVVVLNECAFSNCKKLTSITLSKNIETMQRCIFEGCTLLKEISIPKYVTQMHSSRYGQDYGALNGSSIETVIFESGRTNIPYMACQGDTCLKKVVIPSGVTSIGANAFSDCTNEAIYGYADSYAQAYANENNIEFVELECNHSNKTIKYAYSASTCDNGYTGDTYCASCGLLLTEGKSIPATGHLYELIAENKPTCTDEGSRKYVCSVCGNGYIEYLPATNHNFTSKIVDATCQNSGYTIYTCSVCGYSYKTDFTALGEHNYVDSVTRPANCVQSGKIVHTCSVCGDSYVEIIPMTEHIYETIVIAPTPNKRGYTKHTCSVCGDSYIDHYTDYGDLDGDGIINSNDYAMLKSYVMCQSSLTEEQRMVADFDGDGTVDAFDVIALDVYIHKNNA